jgi:methyl-accepting chemotaxis protein
MKIKRKLPIFISVLVAVPLIFTSVIISMFASGRFKGIEQDRISELSRLGGENIASLIQGEVKEVELLARQKEVIEVSKIRNQDKGDSFFNTNAAEHAYKTLKDRYSKLTHHEHLFIIDTNGIIFADSNPASLKIDLKERPYFKEAMTGKTAISNTIVSKVDGKIVVVFVSPVLDESGEIIAVMANSVYVDYFTKYLGGIKAGKSGYAYMVDSQGLMLSHPQKDKIAKPVENDAMKKVIERINSGEQITTELKDYDYNGVKKVMGYTMIPGVKWTLAVTEDYKDIFSTVNVMLQTIIITAIIALILAATAGIFFSRSITKPIEKLMKSMGLASEGDVTVRSDIDSKDELGELSRGFNTMVENIEGVVRMVKQKAETIEGHSQNLSSVSEEMSSSSEEVAGAIQEVARSTGEQAGGLSDISGIITEFGREIEKIVKSIQDIDTSSQSVNTMALESSSNLEPMIQSVKRVGESFNNFVDVISKLGREVTQINAITEMITNIANQTNLLALNAAIEAARAGEAGRGFAVVADEVRKLAEQSKSSSDNISKLIEGISSQTNLMMNSAGEVKEDINNQISVINVVVDSFKEIIYAIENIIPKIEEVNSSAMTINNEKDLILVKVESVAAIAEEVSASSEEIAASSEEMTASSEEVASSAEELSSMTKEMIQEVNKFRVD